VRRFWFRVRWPFVALSALIAFALGYLGFWAHLADAHLTEAALKERMEPLNHGDYLYYTLQLFMLEFSGGHRTVNLPISIARVLAPATAAWAAIQAVVLLFDEELGRLWLRLGRGHVVICGLGKHGLHLMREFHDAGLRVVVVDAAEDNEFASSCEKRGVIVINGDARNPSVMAEAAVVRASRVLAVCGDDDTNLGVAVAVSSALQATRRKAPLPVHLAILEPRFYHLLKQHEVVNELDHGIRLHVFNMYENAARLLLRDHPLDADLPGPEDGRTPHLVLIGFGKMGQAIAVQAAKVGHLANGQAIAVTAIDTDVVDRKEAFLGQYPRFGSVCDIEYIAASHTEATAHVRMRELAGDPDRIVRFVVCLDSDSTTLLAGLDLLDKIPGIPRPVMLRMSSAEGLASLLQRKGAASEHAFVPFGMASQSCNRDVLLNRILDLQARAIHEDYLAQRIADGGGAPDDPSRVSWLELPERLKDSNRQQADHIAVKLRAVGAEVVAGSGAGGAAFTFSEEEVEVLSQMEHSRWNAERGIAGWRYGPVKNAELKTTPYLVDWEDLEENIREYDREAVRRIPALVRSAGRAIRRKT